MEKKIRPGIISKESFEIVDTCKGHGIPDSEIGYMVRGIHVYE